MRTDEEVEFPEIPMSEWQEVDSPDAAASRTNDVFSQIITDAERKKLLKAPAPLIVESIADTIRGLKDEKVRRTCVQDTVHFVNRQGKIPPVAKEYLDYVSEGKKKQFAAFTGGQDSEYLAIYCGFINGIRRLKGENERVVDEISQSLSQISEKNLVSNPSGPDGQKAIQTIINNFSKQSNL